MGRKIPHCKFCDTYFHSPDEYVAHLESKHSDMIPKDMVPYQFYYYLMTGKTHGSCVMDKAPTKWNPSTNKYSRFCDNPKCKEKYIKEFRSRMVGKYGKITLLNEPEQQRIMLANRSISGTYKWSDGTTKTYTGSYELAFLKFLDLIMMYDSNDVFTPSPHTYYYVDTAGVKRFYIPDIYIASLNTEIEIKDGGDNPNKMQKIQEVDKVKEKLKDEVMKTNGVFNYVKIVNKEHKKFMMFLDVMKQRSEDDKGTIYMP